MHPRYLAIFALVLLLPAGLAGVLFGLQQNFWIDHHRRYAAESRTKAEQLKRVGQQEQARWAEEDTVRDERYAAESERNRMLGVAFGGGVAALSVVGIGLLLVFPSAGRSAGGRFDAYLQAIVQPQLRPGEQVLNTGLLFEGSLKRPILYCAALTTQRLLLVQTGMTLFFGKPIFQGQQEIDLATIRHCTAGGVGFHREITLLFQDGSTWNLRMNMLASAISGQEAFLAEVPQRLAGRGVNVIR